MQMDQSWWLGRRFKRDGIIFYVSSFQQGGRVRLMASDGSSGLFYFSQIQRAWREGHIQEVVA